MGNGEVLSSGPHWMSCLFLRWCYVLRDTGRAFWELSPQSLQQLGLHVCASPLNRDPDQRGAGVDLLGRTDLHAHHNQPGGALVVSQQQGQAGEGLFRPALRTIFPHRAAHHHHPGECVVHFFTHLWTRHPLLLHSEHNTPPSGKSLFNCDLSVQIILMTV